MGNCNRCWRKTDELDFFGICSTCSIKDSIKKSSEKENTSYTSESSDNGFSFLPTLFLGLFCIGFFFVNPLGSILIFIIGYLLFKYLDTISVFYPVVKWVLLIINVPLLLFFIYFLLFLFGVVDDPS